MKTNKITSLIILLACAFCSQSYAAKASKDKVKIEEVKVSSYYGGAKAQKAIDGVVSDNSRWVSSKSTSASITPWLEVLFDKKASIKGIHLYSAFKSLWPVNDFTVSYLKEGKWTEIPSASITDNKKIALAVTFTEEIKTSALRFTFTKTKDNVARIKEIVVWKDKGKELPKLGTAVKQ